MSWTGSLGSWDEPADASPFPEAAPAQAASRGVRAPAAIPPTIARLLVTRPATTKVSTPFTSLPSSLRLCAARAGPAHTGRGVVTRPLPVACLLVGARILAPNATCLDPPRPLSSRGAPGLGARTGTIGETAPRRREVPG